MAKVSISELSPLESGSISEWGGELFIVSHPISGESLTLSDLYQTRSIALSTIQSTISSNFN